MSGPSADDLLQAFGQAVPVHVWMADPDGQLTFVNERAREYFGKEERELVQDGWKNTLHPADLAATVEKWQHSVRTGEPYRAEFRIQRASDGLYRWHLALALPVRNSSGKIIRWVGSNTDIDEHKRAVEVRDAAASRAASELKRLEQVIMHAPAVMAIYRGPEHEIALVNQQWQRFTGRGNAIGWKVRDLFPETGEGIIEILGEVYATGKPFHANEMHLMLDRDADGQAEDTYWTFTLTRLDEPHHSGYDILVHAVEVTELVQTRKMLRELQSAA